MAEGVRLPSCDRRAKLDRIRLLSSFEGPRPTHGAHPRVVPRDGATGQMSSFGYFDASAGRRTGRGPVTPNRPATCTWRTRTPPRASCCVEWGQRRLIAARSLRPRDAEQLEQDGRCVALEGQVSHLMSPPARYALSSLERSARVSDSGAPRRRYRCAFRIRFPHVLIPRSTECRGAWRPRYHRIRSVYSLP